MKESAITKKILEWLEAQAGVFCVKIAGGLYQRAGLPDIHATVAGRSVWLEVKQPGNTTTPLQEATIARLFVAGAVVAVVHSLDEAKRLVEPLLLGGPAPPSPSSSSTPREPRSGAARERSLRGTR